MHYKNELEKRIEREKLRILDLKSQLDKAEAFVLGLQEALRLIPKDSELIRKPETVLRVGSDMARAREILLEAKQPMYINDILNKLGKEPSKSNRENIGGSLGNYARRNEIFTRTAPNTFGLVEFENSDQDEEQEESQEESLEQDIEGQKSLQQQEKSSERKIMSLLENTKLSKLPKLPSFRSHQSNEIEEKDDDVPW